MIYLGSDHRGFELKSKIIKWLDHHSYDYEDLGPFEYDKDDDYPDYATAVATAVALSLSKGESARGILICGSGVGIVVAANKIKGIRAGTMTDSTQAKAATNDEDINVIGLSADFASEERNIEIVKAFLETKFSGLERHVRRVWKIQQLERGNK